MKLLAPFGILCSRIVDLRNLLYDRGLLKSHDLGVRTISVGNLTTGGTGKTPLVALIARIVIDEDESVCILTRGYARRNPSRRVLVSDGVSVLVEADEGGDEPVELALKLEGKAIIVADPDRVAAAKWAREKFSVSTFILDDGFQHRRARRDLDIVCIDATNPCGNGQMLPAGPLRESFKSLKRADAIVITRTEQVDDTKALENRLTARNPSAPIFRAKSEIRDLISIEEFQTQTHSARGETPEKLVAFTGIGNPENFFRSLQLGNYEVVLRERFPDHHRYTQSDISRIEGNAKTSGVAALVTTAKDAVKLNGLSFTLPCYVALAETTIDHLDAFRNLITTA